MFIKEALIDLLTELTGAQESIEKVSVWLQQYKDQAPVIAQAWKNFYFEASEDKKLTLLFLVNDVLQHTKRKGPHFVDAFGYILPKCLAECKELEAKTQIERMLDIWESREVFHKHIISAMKYNLDSIGMEETHVKLTDLMDSLDILRSQEKKSSEVLTKLSHRLDTTDFANAFNVTSRKEGDKYAADFDETAHFLDQYCSCLLKQTEARSDMVKKMNTTLFQMEKSEESIKSNEKDYKNQQASLVKTRKAITSRQMLIDEGMVNFGDDSPDREQIENLTSEEEDVDIEGIETVESKKVISKQVEIIDILIKKYMSFCLNLEANSIFISLLHKYNIKKENNPVIWICIYYLAVTNILQKAVHWMQKQDNVDFFPKFSCKPNVALKFLDTQSYIKRTVKSTQSSYQVMVMTGHYGPTLPSGSSQPPSSSSVPGNDSKFGPVLPSKVLQSEKFGPSLPSTSLASKFGPALPSTKMAIGPYGPALSLPQPTSGSPDNVKYGPQLAVPIQKYPSFGPVLPPPQSLASCPPLSEGDKFGPVLPKKMEKNEEKMIESKLVSKSFMKQVNSKLPPAPKSCQTSIDRLLLLYNTDPEVIPGTETNLQQVFGGTARGFDPNNEKKEPKIISKSLPLSPKNKELACEKVNEPQTNVLEPLLKAYLGTFEPPKFSDFPADKVEAVIKGKVDGKSSSQRRDKKESTLPRSHDSKRSRSDSGRKRSSESSRRSDHNSSRRRERERSPEITPFSMTGPMMSHRPLSIAAQEMSTMPPPLAPIGPQLSAANMFGPPMPTVNTQSSFGPPIPPNLQQSSFGPPILTNNQPNRFCGPPSHSNNNFGPPMPPSNNFRPQGISNIRAQYDQVHNIGPRHGSGQIPNMGQQHGSNPMHNMGPQHGLGQLPNMMSPHGPSPVNHIGPPIGIRSMINNTISSHGPRSIGNMPPYSPRMIGMGPFHGPQQTNGRLNGNFPSNQHRQGPFRPPGH